MNCPLSSSPLECLEERRKVFQSVHYPWQQTPCENCKCGITHETEDARHRTPTCDRCGGQIHEDSKSGLCRVCSRVESHKTKRVVLKEVSCLNCHGTILVFHKDKEKNVCLECRSLSKFRPRKTSCKICSVKINNTSGVCWRCRDERRGKKCV